ncbi:MAG: ABC transporter substrate-binding protein [Roseovarius sp.]
MTSLPQSHLHPFARTALDDLNAGRLNRRAFLSRVTALGVTAATAGSLAGRPAQAQSAGTIQTGGTLRIQQNVKALSDPRRYEWSEQGNMTRGFLEYLVEYQSDGSFTGMLLQGWSVNEDATEYTLTLRPNVRWNNGDAFGAHDVLFNLERWCDGRAEGNSMATRLSPLMDPDTQSLRSDAAEIVNDTTLRLRLSRPDISLIANLSDYPAAVMHPSYDGSDPVVFGIGTGPFRPVSFEAGVSCVLERATDHTWWGTDVLGGPYLDRIEMLDYGTNPSVWLEAAQNDEIDMVYETIGNFVDVFSDKGWDQSAINTAATLVIRLNQSTEIDGRTPYADVNVRRALAQIVDNEICLELGYFGQGVVARNDHVSPIHPAYADIPAPEVDVAGGKALLQEAGMAEFTFELVTIDDEWQARTGDAVAAMMRDAGLNVNRRVESGPTFWPNWRGYPFSATLWNHRPLAVQLLSLAYRSDATWNETGYANPDFDALLDQAMAIPDAETRRPVMQQIQQMLRDDGVMIQPYWRQLVRHHNGNLIGAEMHPSHEIHLHKIGFSA